MKVSDLEQCQHNIHIKKNVRLHVFDWSTQRFPGRHVVLHQNLNQVFWQRTASNQMN